MKRWMGKTRPSPEDSIDSIFVAATSFMKRGSCLSLVVMALSLLMLERSTAMPPDASLYPAIAQTRPRPTPQPRRPARPTPPNPRTGYTAVALSTLPSIARLPGENPWAITLTTFPTPSSEGNFQEQVIVDYSNPNGVVVTLIYLGLLDDSTRGIRYRLEFSPAGSQSNRPLWQVAWVGRQQLCQPGRGSQNWSSENCR